MDITIRIKRHRQTYFINTPPNITIYKLKQLLSKITHKEVKSSGFTFQKTMLENNVTIDQVGIMNDSIVHMVYAEENVYEPVQVPDFEPLQ